MVDFDSDTLSKILISEEVYAMLLNHFDLRGMKDSRDVAEKLQMEHKNLLRIIEQILKTNEPSCLSGEEGSSAHSANELNCLSGEEGSSAHPLLKHFRRSIYIDTNKKERPKFTISPEGMEILINSLTGRKASQEVKDFLTGLKQNLADRQNSSTNNITILSDTVLPEALSYNDTVS